MHWRTAVAERPAEGAAYADLAEEIAQFYADPLGFVMFAYPWGEPGPLEDEPGPDENQVEFLKALGEEVRSRGFDGKSSVDPVRMAESSGHNTGKSAMGAWITNWIMSTRPYSIGTVTAGTAMQLEERTWAAIQKWTRLCITSHWWEVQAHGIYAMPEILDDGQTPENWKCLAQTCKEENAQSFAGQHARGSTSWYLFDEASVVPDGIWKVAYGGISGDEDMMFAWGQPERNTGEFYDVCFGRFRDRWNHRTVDSRSSRFTNKELIAEWEADYGVDSDWYRVRVLGLPPRADELQFIDKGRIEAAGKRKVSPLFDEPLIAGFDVSGGGKAWNVIRFRRGLDGNALPPVRLPGETSRETLITKAAEILGETTPERRVSMMFVDSAFGAVIVDRLQTLKFKNVQEINFGGESPNIHQHNMRAYMWNAAKDWLPKGAIDGRDDRLAIDLATPGYHLNPSRKLVIEAKEAVVKRLGRSPDDADAFVLTFARNVAPAEQKKQQAQQRIYGGDSYSPFG